MLRLNLKKVAITGGLSGGKSTVCRFFKELGAYVVSADEIVHQLLSTSIPLKQQIVDLFGSDVIIDGEINRSQIAKLAFRQPTLLQSLEELLHPAVRDEIEKQYRYAASSSSSRDVYPLFIAEIPLLFETGADRLYDATIAVVADPKLCAQRYIKATGRDIEEFNRRMDRQLPQEEKAARANFVIVNSGDLTDLKKEVCRLYQILT